MAVLVGGMRRSKQGKAPKGGSNSGAPKARPECLDWNKATLNIRLFLQFCQTFGVDLISASCEDKSRLLHAILDAMLSAF